MQFFDEIDGGSWHDDRDDIRLEPLVTRESIVADAPDREWSREEWLDWYESEFAGYAPDDDPDSFVVDDAGESETFEDVLSEDGWTYEERPGEPIRVPQWQLASDRATLAHLQRGWRGTFRFSPDGSRSVVGEHPFSTEEGSAEWLQRARIEMRQLYREAKTDRERSAIKAREAALRARHNARCWGRAFARYWKLNEAETLSMVNAWQKQNPIGWLGLEAAMESMFEACWDHYYAARDAWHESAPSHTASWNVALKRYDVRRVTRAEQDAWLDREPTPPEHPTHLVSSSKKLRRETVGFIRVEEEFVTHHTRIVGGQAVSTPIRRGSTRVIPVGSRPLERVGELGVSGTTAEVARRRRREAVAQRKAEREARFAAHRVRFTRGNVRFYRRETETEWWATRKEWELSGDELHTVSVVSAGVLEHTDRFRAKQSGQLRWCWSRGWIPRAA